MENNNWKILVGLGVLLMLAGLVVYLVGKSNGWFLGRLPGDILVNKKGFTFYIPLATSIIISIILSLLLYFYRKYF